MFRTLRGLLQGEQLIHCSSVGQQNESPVIKIQFNVIVYLVTQQLYEAQYTTFSFKTGDSFCGPTLLECITYTH